MNSIVYSSDHGDGAVPGSVLLVVEEVDQCPTEHVRNQAVRVPGKQGHDVLSHHDLCFTSLDKLDQCSVPPS